MNKTGRPEYNEYGNITLRDFLAAQVVQGFLYDVKRGDFVDTALLAFYAYKMADSMLKAREQ